MSHWTRLAVKIKSKELMQRASEKLGLHVDNRVQDFRTIAGTQKVDMLIQDARGGSVGLAKEQDGSYQMVYDTWNNSLTNQIGSKCEKLMQEYTAEVTRAQVLSMGGMITNEAMQKDGSLQIRVSVG